MEINPRHKTTQDTHDLWHKIVGIIMHKNGWREVLITSEDVEKMSAGGFATVLVENTKEGLRISFVQGDGANRIAAIARAESDKLPEPKQPVVVQLYHITKPEHWNINYWTSYCKISVRGKNLVLTNSNENKELLKSNVQHELGIFGYKPRYEEEA